MKVKPLATVEVVPILPEPVKGLKELACNLIWSWNPDIASLFRALDSELWEAAGHNPVRILREISQLRLDQIAQDPVFVDHYNRCQSYLRALFPRARLVREGARPRGRDGNRLFFDGIRPRRMRPRL